MELLGVCWDLWCRCCLELVGSDGRSFKELGIVGNYWEGLMLLDTVEDCLELSASVGDCWQTVGKRKDLLGTVGIVGKC